MKNGIPQFSDLKVGDIFIALPTDGDNAGHGGYTGKYQVFTKTVSDDKSGFAENVKTNTESTIPNSMEVIELNL